MQVGILPIPAELVAWTNLGALLLVRRGGWWAAVAPYIARACNLAAAAHAAGLRRSFPLSCVAFCPFCATVRGRLRTCRLGSSGIFISNTVHPFSYTLHLVFPMPQYVGAYQMSFGPISWLLCGEVFPLKVRQAEH